MPHARPLVALSCLVLSLGCSRAVDNSARATSAPSSPANQGGYELAAAPEYAPSQSAPRPESDEEAAPEPQPVVASSPAPAPPAPAKASAPPAGAKASAPSAARAVAQEKKSAIGALAVAPIAPTPAVTTNASPSTEAYAYTADNAFVSPTAAPLSTFSVDVDTASYSNVRRYLTQGSLPPADAVRVEELINYFTYSYPNPEGDVPFSVTTEYSKAPWNPEHGLLLVGLQGKRLSAQAVPPKNLVFLIDVSGSMSDSNKLPLLKYALTELVKTLDGRDRVAIVAYAGSSGVVLEPTTGDQKAKIEQAITRLSAGGSTNGASGIVTAYELAERALNRNGINRVILATDGDFNVGVSSQGDLVRLIEKRRDAGIALTVLGFGMGNYKDDNLEKLADHGNGNYAYIDNASEARKVLVESGTSTLVTIAKDVKIQVEFNPEQVESYRLIGYENRALAARDFNDDRKDAGDIGAGHSVTALYELVPAKGRRNTREVDALRYQQSSRTAAATSQELASVKLRYKQPKAATSELVKFTVDATPRALDHASNDLRFAASVAGFGMLLRKSEHRGAVSYDMVRNLARSAQGNDLTGYRQGFLSLISDAERLDPAPRLSVARD